MRGRSRLWKGRTFSNWRNSGSRGRRFRVKDCRAIEMTVDEGGMGRLKRAEGGVYAVVYLLQLVVVDLHAIAEGGKKARGMAL